MDEHYGTVMTAARVRPSVPGGLIGKSHSSREIGKLVTKYAPEKAPVLLNGETGAGKNHIAELIHRYSRRKGAFIVVDTPNIDGSLFESKLFGHKKGAFTDARFDKNGLVKEADKGTLLFDEITEVPLDVQTKLLRFLDTSKYYVLGESNEKTADVRIIAATNVDLHEAVLEKKFRKDLYYRLNVLEIVVPPLRERKEDIESIVKQHIGLLRGMATGQGFWEVMLGYDWPGNVRELLNILERIGILLDEPITGKKVAPLIYQHSLKYPGRNFDKFYKTKNQGRDQLEDHNGGTLQAVREKVKNGGDFWDLIWKPFIERDFDRKTVKSILDSFYYESACCFRQMLGGMNVPVSDYQTFMSLLYKYDIDPRK